MLFSLLKQYLDTDTALKVSQSVYCFTTSISHGVENYFPRLWGRASLMLFFITFFEAYWTRLEKVLEMLIIDKIFIFYYVVH